MKKAIIIHTIQTLCLWVIIYLIRSFAIFELENPFKWIIDMPTYSINERSGILGCFLCYTFISCLHLQSKQNDT